MAKQGVKDIRIDFIEAIGRTENLRTLRSVVAELYNRKVIFNISEQEIVDMFNEGYERIKQLLGKDCFDFAPMILMHEWTPEGYFTALTKGYKEVANREKANARIVLKKAKLEEHLDKARIRGDFAKVKDYENELACLNKPDDRLKAYNNMLKRINREEKRDIKIIKEADFVREQGGLIDENEYLKVQARLGGYERSKKDIAKYIKKINEVIDIRKKCEEMREVPLVLPTDKMGILEVFNRNNPILLIEGMRNLIRYYFSYTFYEWGVFPDYCWNSYLEDYEGIENIDFEHTLLLYNALKKAKYNRLNEIEALLIYTLLEHIALNLWPIRSKECNVSIRCDMTDYGVESIPCYTHKYTACYIVPKGYKGYIFEPACLNQQSLISAIDKDNLAVEMMVSKYKEAQKYMRRKRNGILYTFLSKELEDKLIPSITTAAFAIHQMDGEYGKILFEELKERRNLFTGDSTEVMTNMYKRVVHPYNLEVMGSYIRTFCNKLAYLKDKSMIYIYYLSPQRVGIAVREDVSEEAIREVFDEKFIEVWEEVKKPKLEDLLTGLYL